MAASVLNPADAINVTASPPGAPDAHHFTFRELLSELNPLQYIPGIGTLYRAMTGNTIPVSVRDTGSLLFSGLIGGPVGIAMNVGELVAEKVTGLDPEKLGDKLLARIGIHHREPATTEVAAESSKLHAAVKPEAANASPWSSAQLAAYGVTTAASGELKLGALAGSDVLNSLELEKLNSQQAAAQYAATAASTG